MCYGSACCGALRRVALCVSVAWTAVCGAVRCVIHCVSERQNNRAIHINDVLRIVLYYMCVYVGIYIYVCWCNAPHCHAVCCSVSSCNLVRRVVLQRLVCALL